MESNWSKDEKFDRYYKDSRNKNVVKTEDRIKSDRGNNYDKERSDSKNSKSFAKPTESDEDSSDNYTKSSKHKKSSHRKKRKLSTSGDEKEERKNSKYEKNRDKNQSHKHKNFNKGFARPPRSSSSGSSDDNKEESRRKERKSQSYHSGGSNKYSNKECKKTFSKPSHESSDESDSRDDRHRPKFHKSFSSSSRGWRKKTDKPDKEVHQTSDDKVEVSSSQSVNVEEPLVAEREVVLTDQQLNELAAKLVKAELLGNVDLANELKAKLEKAREIKASKPKESGVSEEVVILTHTDSKGFTRPVSLGGPLEPTGGRRKAKKTETHSGGKRMRYFADDDKYSLQEMFQREKLNTVEDSNELFARLASKGVGADDSTRDMDDVFEETARMEEAEGRKQVRERQRAIEQSKRTARSLENCQWCLESRQMQKHLIISIGNTCYLCVPPHQSLTENHCLIVPTHHSPCATQLDEDVWREMQDIRKKVVQMFLSQEEDVVFFESARYLNKFPHMVLNCVPMPKETGDLAPIYFKKAIQECEMEWSNNKKLVELRGRDVRRAVPKGLPYFAVDFGMDSGFAHVIEDEKLFPHNFAQEIIGGMLDLDHSIWRKQRRQTFEEQSKKVVQLSKLWKTFESTTNND